MANEKIPRTFLTFEKFNKSRRSDWHFFSRNHFIILNYCCIYCCYFNFMSTSHQEIHFPMIIPFLRVFSCHFEPLVHRQHWLALKIEYLFSSESLTIEIGDPGAPWGCWDVSPDMTRSEEMWWGWSLWERYSREYFMTTTDPRSVMISTLRLLRPWLCCYNNYYYTGAGNE